MRLYSKKARRSVFSKKVGQGSRLLFCLCAKEEPDGVCLNAFDLFVYGREHTENAMECSSQKRDSPLLSSMNYFLSL